jgi:hypothetical protein
MKSQPECIYGDDDPKCVKCTADHKGCFWDEVSRAGQREKRTRMSRKAKETVVDLTEETASGSASKNRAEVVVTARPKRQVKREPSPASKNLSFYNTFVVSDLTWLRHHGVVVRSRKVVERQNDRVAAGGI